jgi:small subunit ribosomal protein S8
MSVTDPVADALTQIRNALRIGRDKVDVRANKLLAGMMNILKKEGFIQDARQMEEGPRGYLRVYLKYGPDGEKLIRRIRRVSTPGRRVYRGASSLGRILRGQGVTVLSTNRGVLSDRDCRERGVGGEVLCEVW